MIHDCKEFKSYHNLNVLNPDVMKELDNIEIEGINTKDYPDFCDAYVQSASWTCPNCGKEIMLTEKELEDLSDDHNFMWEQIQQVLY